MQADNHFDPEQVVLLDCKILASQLETPENFDPGKVAGHNLEHTFQLGFNLQDKLAKAEISIFLKSDSQHANAAEASASFRLMFVYSIPQLDLLAQVKVDKSLQINPQLANALASVTYSTTRGILIGSVKGTVFQHFILPIIHPNKLVHNK
jgi:hypothetical protein